MKKTLTKITTILLAVIMMIPVFAFSGCAGGNRLDVYMWDYFLDEDIIPLFEAWYYEETGRTITVHAQTFDTNDDVLRELRAGYRWDVINPSDYMIQKLITDNNGNSRIQRLDQERFAEHNVLDKFFGVNGVGDPRIIEAAKYFDDDQLYAIPYLWGTFGFMYNYDRISSHGRSLFNSWEAFWNPYFNDTDFYMIDSIRDAYSVAMLYVYREHLARYQENARRYAEANDIAYYDDNNPHWQGYRALLTSLFREFNETRRQQAWHVLHQLHNRATFETSDNSMWRIHAGEEGYGKFGFQWACNAGHLLVNPDWYPEVSIGYVVPNEGTNLWMDAWIIPTTARNPVAANMWIYFNLKQNIAEMNIKFAGAPSGHLAANNGARAHFEALYTANDIMFTRHTHPDSREQFMEIVFPSEATLRRAAVMSDFGDMENAMRSMYNSVLIGQAPSGTRPPVTWTLPAPI